MRSLARSTDKPEAKVGNFRRLAWFRYRLRCFLHFSEKMARSCGVTPQQHQLLLGVAGYTGRGYATISELAEFLQARHNAVVGLVQRAVRRGLVRKLPSQGDRRFVRVLLTRRGLSALKNISRANIEELHTLRFEILQENPPRRVPAAQGA